VNDFQGKVAIVTGTTGIGKAVAKRLARGGGSVLACGIDIGANEALAKEAETEGIAIRVQRCDVS
jgi:meso-butanediol dehydrogenase/(S,S)-butanediol dehydrogenase/diacetyl reductase